MPQGASLSRKPDPGVEPRAFTISGAPEGLDALVIADLARREGRLVFVARDDRRAARLADALSFFAPDLPVLSFPAWDCLPYDRASPRAEILSRRMATLAALAHRDGTEAGRPFLVIATVNAVMQRVPPRAMVADSVFRAAVGETVDTEALLAFLARNGYARTSTVMEPGDYAVRGGLIDLFPPGAEEPLRLDFFGAKLDAIRRFDPTSQRSTAQERALELVPAAEILLDKESIERFRQGYRAAFGAVTGDDPLYEAVSEGRKALGMEHWLPLFYPRLETLFDYVPEAGLVLDHQADEARKERLSAVADYYSARKEHADLPARAPVWSAPPYNPLPPTALYLDESEWQAVIETRPLRRLTPFRLPAAEDVRDAGGRPGRDFADMRVQEGVNVFDAVVAHIGALHAKGLRVILASWSEGARERLSGVLAEHGLADVAPVASFPEVGKLPRGKVALAVLGIEHGFETESFALISEEDILGERLIRRRPKRRRAADFVADAASLQTGDLVVHVDHGIGRYEGLHALEVAGAPHDCLLLVYQGGDKLYIPVENIDLLSRYGSEDTDVPLDRLGGTGWQQRKARLKKRIRDMAAELIKIAAARELKPAERVPVPHGLYEEFCARFPYEETEDQARAIAEVIDDLSRGRPMDRLVCGDVGFGKTEVALRAVFLVAMAGKQVAVVVPTTLLARQHLATFRERFAGLPLKVRQLSRLVSAKERAETKAGLASGDVDVVIGTHALLSKTITFKNLGLVVVDEEQHFGVRHKERLKQIRADTHVLTLTATPIPRTLQLALSGVREMSVIATPPVDRLAVRTFVTPFDPVIVREALLRERYRGGQSFYVCPRIADLPEAAAFLREQVPEVKFAVAHGQLPARTLDNIMNAFYDRTFDVLLSTQIIESGLDIPSVNTMIVHRADRFGLAQLYQLRGRIGRAKLRAYAYLTYPARQMLTPGASRRLDVLQALDSLGAGFSVASHDLDIRGAGNLLGEEQSGHIREVGVELYQEMLEEAVAALRGGTPLDGEEQWSPQISVGASVLIPESYVSDLDVRLELYRRLSRIEEPRAIEAFAAELIDRFGPLPQEVEGLLKVVAIKALCRAAGVERIEAGPKGATVSFRGNRFANPEGLVSFITAHAGSVKLRPDQTLVYLRRWDSPAERLKGAHHLLSELSNIAKAA